MAEGVMLLTTCPSAGVSTPTTVAIASIAAVATRRMAHPLPAGKPGTDILYRLSAAPCVFGSIAREVAGCREAGSGLFSACDRGFDELAAFGQFVQHGVQFSQIVTREPATCTARRWARHRPREFRHRHRRLRLGRTMDRAFARFDARHRRALKRRLAARACGVLALTEIAADQRGEPAAQAAALLNRFDVR